MEPAVILLKNKLRFSHSLSVPSNSQTRAIAVKRGLEKLMTSMYSQAEWILLCAKVNREFCKGNGKIEEK